MKFRFLAVALGVTFAGAFALSATPAQATETTSCNVQGWYVNPDETDNAPTSTEAGFVFEGKDLIHHATAPLDFPDVKTNTGSFVATTPGKVVFKMETENPYSTIVQQADGQFWSTAMTYDQEGGQGHPVANVSDLLGKDVKPGKVKFSENSHVVTFGVGYWVEEGSTVVSSISFHGTKYDLTCKPAPETTPTTKPTATASATARPTATASVSSTPPVVGGVGGSDAGPSLPVTGTNMSLIAAIGVVFLVVGAGVVLFTGRKKRFIP